jgi:hypothetical protein
VRQARRVDARFEQPGFEIRDERLGPAESVLGVEREVEIEQGRGGDPSFGVEVAPEDLPPVGARVAKVPVAVAEPREVLVHLVAERVLAPVARAVDPPHLALGPLGGEGLQQRQHRRRADSGADEHNRARAGSVQDEATARSGELDRRAGLERAVEVLAHQAAPLALHADPKAAAIGRARQRVAARDPAGIGDVGAHRDELAGLVRRHALAPRGHEDARAIEGHARRIGIAPSGLG